MLKSKFLSVTLQVTAYYIGQLLKLAFVLLIVGCIALVAKPPVASWWVIALAPVALLAVSFAFQGRRLSRLNGIGFTLLDLAATAAVLFFATGVNAWLPSDPRSWFIVAGGSLVAPVAYAALKWLHGKKEPQSGK